MITRRMGLAAARQTPCSTFAQLGAAAGGADDAGDDNSRAKSAADIAAQPARTNIIKDRAGRNYEVPLAGALVA